MSKKAFTLLVEEAFKNEASCNTKDGYGDEDISRCMESVKIVKVEGVDDQGKAQFFHHNPGTISKVDKTL